MQGPRRDMYSRGKGPVTVPDKLVAHGAKRGLGEKGGRELVALDVVDFGLLDGSPALMQGEESLRPELPRVLRVCGRAEGTR